MNKLLDGVDDNTIDQGQPSSQASEPEQVVVNGVKDADIEMDSMDTVKEQQRDVVGDQPAVFGLTSNSKQTMLSKADDRKQDEIGGQGDNRIEEDYTDSVSLTGSGDSMVNGTSTSDSAQKRTANGRIVEVKDKHRMTQTSGLFGAEGRKSRLRNSWIAT